MTNATKAQIAAAVNIALGLLVTAGAFSATTAGQLAVLVNALVAIGVGLTYKRSRKRGSHA